jgi:hypothetical protein
MGKFYQENIYKYLKISLIFLLSILFSKNWAQTSDLFFSEYVEGSSSNKYIEIYNGTGAAINLADYRLRLYTNGSSSTTNDVQLSGTLQTCSVVVYQNSSAVLNLPPGVTGINNAAVNFNGDDAVVLFKISTNSIVDIIGNIGCDPGTAWINGSLRTEDKTIVRKAAVCGGVTIDDGTNCPFPTLGTEWDVYNIDDVSHLGSHTCNCELCASSNTITSNVVNNPPFALNSCTDIAVGTVSFTSSGTFNNGNIYTAQLSDASGSFTPAVSIGSISSTANSGVITFTIPAGSASGTGYMIRVVSDNPVVIGSNSTVFTITTSCTPTLTPGGTVTACAISGAMSIYDKCNNGQGCTTGCDLTSYSNLGYNMCDGSSNNSNCFGVANPGGQQLQGIVFNIPSGCTMSVTVEFKTRGGSCSNSGMDNGDYLKINGTTYTGSGNADITQSITQTGGSIFIEQSANRSDEILTFTASIVSGSCPQCSLLGVELLNFSCNKKENDFLLSWATSSEHNSKNFEIECSDDGINFKKIAEILAKGNSEKYLNYNVNIDKEFNSEIVYFRLKINELNNQYTYSPICFTQNKKFTNITIYPNPSDNNYFLVNVNQDEEIQNSLLQLFDLSGKLLLEEPIVESQTKINTQNFADGIYFLKISTPYKTQNHKVIIQNQ